jgi:hypothetical protein
MANKEHLALLSENSEIWNRWRDVHPDIVPDLQGVTLHKAFLRHKNLSGANLSQANLSGADLSQANLSQANLSGANLNRAFLFRAKCYGSNLDKADLCRANLSEADFGKANLNQAILDGTHLYQTKFTDAHLSNAHLNIVHALATDFTGAILTGTSIKGWNIDSRTRLDGIICEYIYLGLDQQDRRPRDPNQTFAPGEFTALYQKVLDTVDLIFADGIDWKAFFQSFQELRSQYGDENIAIQAIEKKSGDAFVIQQFQIRNVVFSTDRSIKICRIAIPY